MDKRYQVFVNSTYTDLMEERNEVMQALLELNCMPAGMELFPAANEDQWNWIKRVIDESDYYVVIVAGRYGSVSELTAQSVHRDGIPLRGGNSKARDSISPSRPWPDSIGSV